METSVRYGDVDDDVLRSVLYDLYRSRCYSCKRPKDFTDIQTDHIIPKSLTGDDLREALEGNGLPKDFDLNDPQNLAPICGSCNGPGGKGNRSYTHLPVVAIQLEKSKRLAPDVVKGVMAFRSQKKLGDAFVRLKAADLEDDDTRTLFEQNMPAILRKVATARPGLADLPIVRTVDFLTDSGQPRTADLELRGVARAAAETFEYVTGAELDDFLEEPVTRLWDQVHIDSQSALENLDRDGEGPVAVGPPVAQHFQIDVSDLALEQTPTSFEFTFAGTFDTDMAASVMRDDPYGWESSSRDLQGDVVASGRFSFTTVWFPGDNPNDDLEAGDITIENWEADAWLSP